MAGVTPFIWFEGVAEEAMNYYASLFPNSQVTYIDRYTGDQGIPDEDKLQGKVLTGIFEIMGTRFMCLDGSPQFGRGGPISFMVELEAQDELDQVWDKLTADGGKPIQCGWITDKFNITWQIVPAVLGRLMSDQNATEAQKKALTEAMMPMVKLDGPKLEEAFNNAEHS